MISQLVRTLPPALPKIAPAALSALLFSFFITKVLPISEGEVLRYAWSWVPSLGFSFSFLIDGLSLTFSLLISGIGALVMLYSSCYLSGHQHFGRFHLYLVLFMLSMLGLVLSDNLMTMFIFWEMTTVTSYLLIGFKHATANSRRSALQALLVTGAGGLALLAGIILIQSVTGTLELSEIRAQGDVIRQSELYLPILLLVLAGTFTKSGQFPFHFWLPNAMAAPTPVSAYLHSATMVKAGIYLMARLHPTLAGTDIWYYLLTMIGAFTAIFASMLALKQLDFKQSLAYTTLMALGTLTLFLGSDTGYAITAAMTFLIVHSLYKAALFLIVGTVDHATGTRNLETLHGLKKIMPITAVAAAVSALSMAGFPPFVGFIGKELKYAGALAVQSEPIIVVSAVVLSNSLMFAIAGILAFKPFWSKEIPATSGGSTDASINMHKPYREAWPMLVGPVLLAICGLVFGLFPQLIAKGLINPSVAVILTTDSAKKLTLWAGINKPLLLSLVTFALGIALYLFHTKLRKVLNHQLNPSFNFDKGWDKLLDGFKTLCERLTDFIQNGTLRHYVFVTLATLAVALAGTLLHKDYLYLDVSLGDVTIKHWVVVAITIAGCCLTLTTSNLIAAIAGLGAVGIGVALIFIIYGAPDVAITQLLVETLVVVLFGTAALKLPQLKSNQTSGVRPLDALLSIVLGGSIMIILLMVTDGPLDRKITDFFEAASWPEAYGRNIVNVILVDFRAIDTFGEIAVILTASLGVLAALTLNPRNKHPDKGIEQ